MRITLLLFLFVTATACAGSGDPDRPDTEDCVRLREHVIDLRLAAADTGGRLNAEDLDQHRAALQAAAGAAYTDDCRNQRTPGEVSCLLATTDLDSLTACTATPASED